MARGLGQASYENMGTGYDSVCEGVAKKRSRRASLGDMLQNAAASAPSRSASTPSLGSGYPCISKSCYGMKSQGEK